jgi:pilus assembly protein CpaE
MKLMETDGSAAINIPVLGDTAYDVVVVEPDPRRRTLLVMMIGGKGARSFESVAELSAATDGGTPTVAVFGPSLADDDGFAPVAALTDDYPEVGVVLVAEQLTTSLLQKALRSGVRDAVVLTENDPSELYTALGRVGQLMISVSSRPVGIAPALAPGKVIVCFSTKGGVGKSVLSTNLAVALAQRSERPVAILDADLQFGDVAVLLGVTPERTVMDAAAAIHHDDPELMRALVMRHDPSGLLVLPAPVEPSTADQIRPEDMLAIVDSMRQFCGTVVIDMPPHFDDMVLALLEIADDVLLVASMDIPSIKNLKVGMQTLDLLALAGPKLRLVLNRANARVKLDVREVEKALGLDAKFPVPSDIAVPQAVNRGVPVVLDNPRSPSARAFEDIATEFLTEAEDAVDESGKRRRFSR